MFTNDTLSVSGRIERVYFSGAKFCAGLLRLEDGGAIRFKGAFCANEGDCVRLDGAWRHDPKYGMQFVADSVSYDLPETQDGLIEYLAGHPAFKGIGHATARKLVEYAGNSQRLETVITGNPETLAKTLKIPQNVLINLREQWLANVSQNRIRTYLSGFGLTVRQMDTLIEGFGETVIGILKANPYLLIKLVDGYGFKRADDIAQKMGVPKDHPGRIEAGIMYCLQTQINDGHTWTGGAKLLDLANDMLALDSLDNMEIIQRHGNALIERGEMVADRNAVSTPVMHEAETLIRETLEEYAWKKRPVLIGAEQSPDLSDSQLDAFIMALRHAICVISGGAGTGKTYTISRIARAFKDAGYSIALCAPTGKAAKRIEELLESYGVSLDASTIHRLLRYDGRTFKRNCLSMDESEDTIHAPAYDIIIIDEFSMVDVPLMATLMKRIDFGRTRLILVGDHNQLPPVGPGNILRDLLEHQLAPSTILTRVHRQAGLLKINSCAVLNGRIAPTAGAEDGWIVIDNFKEAGQISLYLRDLIRDHIPNRMGYDPLRDVQVITPMHKGPLGTREINKKLQYLFHDVVSDKDRFAIGDKVIQTKNDYTLNIMNGTMGFIVGKIDKDLIVDFEGVGQKTIDKENVRHLQLAYCLTAHKAQGSEFPCVIVLCHKSHFFADRNWLYTAVTRASKTCILMGDAWGLRHAAGKNLTIERRTLLSKWSVEPTEVSA